MKRTKNALAVLLVGIMTLGALAGCGGGGAKTVEGTYTLKYSLEEITSNTFHNGFVTALGAEEVNTVTLTKDGSYIYTKELHSVGEDGSVTAPADGGALIAYTFTGTYTVDGDKAVLSFPAKCEFSEDWGGLAAAGYFQNSSGSYTWSDGSGSGDIVRCKEEESHVPMDLFVSPYLLDTLTTSESGFDAAKCKVTVTLDDSAKSFSYVIVNTDDE